MLVADPSLIAGAGPATDPEVEALVARSTRAHQALMVGDVDTYRELVPPADDFVLMSPFGGTPTRPASYSNERWESIGRFFRNGRDSTLELVHAWRDADMVVLALIERAHVEVGGLEGQEWGLRVTLVFRRDGEHWHLVHRHADALAQGISLEEAAAIARCRPAS